MLLLQMSQIWSQNTLATRLHIDYTQHNYRSHNYFYQSLAISVSGSKAESLAFAPHEATENTFTYYYDAKAGSFVSTGADSELDWSLHKTVANAGNSDMDELWRRIKMNGGDVFYNRKENSFRVKSGRTSSVVDFKLGDATDASLIAELVYVKTLTKKLATSTKLQKKIADTSPDTISVSFHSLDAIGAKYGVESKQYIAALHLFDSALPLIAHNLQTLSPSSSIGQLVLMGSPVVVDKEVLHAQMKHLALNANPKFLPSLYLERSGASADSCQVLRMNLDMTDSNLKVTPK